MQSRVHFRPNRGMKLSVNQLIDILSILCVLIFSTREYITRLLPSIPYVSIGYLLFALLLASLLLNQKRINTSALVFIGGVIVVCVINWFLSSGLQKEYIYSLLIEPFTFVKLWVYFIIFSLVREPAKFRRNLLVIAYVNMFLLMLTTVSGLYAANGRVLNYVGLGISGAMWIPLIILHAFITDGRKRTFFVASAVVFVAFVAVYGNRGSLIAIIGFIVYCFIRYTQLKRKFAIASVIGIIAILVYAFQDAIRNLLISRISGFGLFSRNLNLLISGQLSYTTHRTDEIWVRVAEAIKNNWLTGYGLCYDRVLNGSLDIYAHNLALEVFLSFGVILGLILLLLHLNLGINNCVKIKETEWEYLFTPFYITSTLLLMFNNSFCLLSSFWIPYGVFFALKKARRAAKNQDGRNS